MGGAFEFTYGAQLAPGGKSILCLPSRATLRDGRVVSNIVDFVVQAPGRARFFVQIRFTKGCRRFHRRPA